MTDKNALNNDLTDAFIEYFWREENPMPAQDESREKKIARYQTDPVFNAKVKSMAAGVMHIVCKHI